MGKRILIEVSYIIVAKINFITFDVNTAQDIILETVLLQLSLTTEYVVNKSFVGYIIIFYGSINFGSEICIINYDCRNKRILFKLVESKTNKDLDEIIFIVISQVIKIDMRKYADNILAQPFLASQFMSIIVEEISIIGIVSTWFTILRNVRNLCAVYL